ncbi:hypothetical protein V6N13_038145 [Hibiscus sabdariffa]
MDPISPRPLNMGLQSLRNDSKLSKVKGKLSWAASIDAKVNAYYNKSDNLLESVSRSLYREANVQLKLTTSKGVVFYLNVVSISWVW